MESKIEWNKITNSCIPTYMKRVLFITKDGLVEEGRRVHDGYIKFHGNMPIKVLYWAELPKVNL